MSKIQLLFFGLFFLFLVSCKKTNNYVIPIKNNRAEITLNADFQILEVAFYQSDTFLYKKINTFLPNSIISVERDNNDNIIKTSTFYLNSFALADSCVDSVFNNNSSMTILLIRNLYDNNGYLSTVNLNYRSIVHDSIVSSSTYDLIYSISNGNVASINVNRDYINYFDYCQIPNKIDILGFIGNCSGKIDNNLRLSTKISGSNGPHTSTPHHTYYYTLNSDGYVIEKVDFYTPSYDGSSEEPEPIKIVTQFKYIFQ